MKTKAPISNTGSNSDPHNIHARVEYQIHLILEEMEARPEQFALKDRLSLVQIVGMYLTRNLKLNASDESGTAGSAVRRYSGAFKTSNVAGRGKASAGRTSAPALAYDSNDDDDSAA